MKVKVTQRSSLTSRNAHTLPPQLQADGHRLCPRLGSGCAMLGDQHDHSIEKWLACVYVSSDVEDAAGRNRPSVPSLDRPLLPAGRISDLSVLTVQDSSNYQTRHLL